MFPSSFSLKFLTIWTSLLSIVSPERIPAGIIDFCFEGVRYSVSTEVCPGGVRLLEPVRPDYDCICMQGVYLSPGALYHTSGQTSSPILISPTLECRLHHNGIPATESYSASFSSRSTCFSQVGQFIERWYMVSLADPAQLERPTLSLWRAPSDDSIYELRDFRRFAQDPRTGLLHVPFENNFHGMIAFYKGLSSINGSDKRNTSATTSLQIGQYCIDFEDNDSILYMSQYSVLFANTSVKYGCTEDSLLLESSSVGPNKGEKCHHSYFCREFPFTRILRYEELLMYNQRPLPKYPEIIGPFKHTLKTSFSDMLELRLNQFKSFSKYVPRDAASTLKLLQLVNQVAQKALQNKHDKSLLENAFKIFVLGTGGEEVLELAESKLQRVMSVLTECLEQSSLEMFQKFGERDALKSAEREDNKFRNNDLVLSVIRNAFQITRAICAATLPNNVNGLRMLENVVQGLYTSPLLDEKFWFLETAHIHILLPGLNNTFVNHLESIVDHISNERNLDKFVPPKIIWSPAQTLYQFRKAALKPGPTTEENFCTGFVIWGGLGCCLQLDSAKQLVPKMPQFVERLKTGPQLCE